MYTHICSYAHTYVTDTNLNIFLIPLPGILELCQANTAFLEFCTSKTHQTTQQASVRRVHFALRQVCGAHFENSSDFSWLHVAGSELAQAGQLHHIVIACHRLIQRTEENPQPVANADELGEVSAYGSV